MRIRHNLKLDEPNDFDLATQDAVLKVWDQISQATFLALVVISSIALMVGGIGVMAIMMISVTERTREIGVRKALGARRREILWQFLIEAVFLTSVGGLLGILFGSSIGLGVHWPVRLPRLAALVVVRDRDRLLGERRHLLRPVSRVQGLAPGSDRSAEIRVASSFQLPASSFQLPALSLQADSQFRKGDPHAGLQAAARVAESAPARAEDVRTPDQILRAVISISSNIAEGAGRGSDPDFRRFLWHSMGSCNELESQLLLASDFKFIPSESHTRLGNDLSEVRKMLSSLIQTLK